MLKSRMAAAALLALHLTACETTAYSGRRAEALYATPPTAISKILSGEMGGIVMDLAMPEYCQFLAVRFQNLANRTIVSKVLTPSDSEVAGHIAPGRFAIVIPVEPGRYMMAGGSCSSTSYGYDVITTRQTSLDSLALWVRPFDVEPGKIVYTGTPRTEIIRREYGVALTFAETFSGRKDRSSDSYALYEVKDESERVRAEVGMFSPELVDRFVSNPTASLLNKEVVRKIVNDAYDQEAGEVAPDDAAAARNRAAARSKVQEGLKAYLHQMLKDRVDELKTDLDDMLQTQT